MAGLATLPAGTSGSGKTVSKARSHWGVLAWLLIAWLPPLQAATLADLQKALEGTELASERRQLIEASADDAVDWPLEAQARRFLMLGLALEGEQRVDDAYAAYDAAVQLLQDQPPGPVLVEALLERSYITYVRTNDTERYCPDREEALRLARLIEVPEALSSALVKVAFCYQTRPERFAEALALLDEALQTAEAEGMAADRRAMIYNATASVYGGVNLHDRAYEFLGKAYELFAVGDDRQDMFNMQHTMVAEAMRLSREADAQKHVQRLFELADSSPEFADFRFFAHYNQGLVHYLAGRPSEAVSAFDQALALEHTTAERYFVDLANGMRAACLHQAGLRDRGLADARVLLASASLEASKELRYIADAIRAEGEGKLEQAVAALWQLDRAQIQARQSLLGNIFNAQARLLDERIAAYDNRFLQQELELQEARLARLESERQVARLGLGLAVAIAAGLLLAAYLLLRSRQRLRHQAQTDALTGLANRRQLLEQAQRWAGRAQRAGAALSLVLLDIDHFKRVNDLYGHQGGDEVLRRVAQVLRDACPASGVAGRIGGEEFAVMLQDDLAAARVCADALRSGLASMDLPAGLANERIRASIGIASSSAADGDPNIELLYRQADEALYAAKAGGRNQVRVWGEAN